MPRRHPTLAERQLLDVLNKRTLRRIEQLTTIGKNRLHRLRSFPLDVRLHELLKMSNARMLDLTIRPCKIPVRRR
jgi:hypothetical protein